MDSMYKQASKMKLRFIIAKGEITPEQLWDISLEDLDNLAVSLERASKRTGSKSFLQKQTTEDETAKLRFDIAYDVLSTRMKENEDALAVVENKEHNARIDALIAQKKNKELEEMSVEQLEALKK